jgi:hypothetical protein
MFSHVKRKFRSQRGASLSMALMLFLVCTTVASIVLSAATAVSGRLSRLKEADASYYNVSSAARFVWDELNRNGGLTVEVTRTCDAQKDEDGNWTGWNIKIDSVLDSSIDTKSSINDGTATLFQVATYDLIMDTERVVAEPPTLDFSSERTPSTTNISSRFDKDGSVPKPVEVVFQSASYKPFKFKAGDLPPVFITVTKNDDQTFDFEFQQANPKDPTKLDEDSYICTLTALVETNGGGLSASPNEDGQFSGGVTTVSWKAISMTVGELS